MFISFLIGVFVFVFGLCVGSFLNCLIFRMEEEKSLAGRSFCPGCKHILSWKDLFPVFSFVFLRGKCRYCKVKISWQYPLVELATGILFLLIFNFQLSIFNKLSILQLSNLIFLFYIASSLIALFVYDLKHFILPDKILIPAIVICLVFNFSLNNIFAGLVAGGFFGAIFLASKGRAMGFGDVKLAFLMGLLLNLPKVLPALFLAFLFGAIISLILIGFYGKKIKSEVPFGPFLVTGTFVALFWGQQIVSWYLKLIY